jgi:hypothetical protein
MTKPFMLMLAVVLALGISIGGAFAGGVALGKSQGEEAGSAGPAAQPASNARLQPEQGQFSQGDLTELRQRFQSGEISPQDLDQLRQRFQSGEINPGDLDRVRQQFAGRSGQGFPGRGGVAGTVEKVEGDTVTVDTSEGPLLVRVGEDTVIQKSAAGTLEDLQTGVRVAVIGEPEEGGGVAARFVVLIPEGGAGLLGGSFSFGEHQEQGQPPEDGDGFFGGEHTQEDQRTP